MKKILSILMILVLVGGVAFAQVEPVFTGDATLSWGIDLGKGDTGDDAKISHGFLNEASASVKIPFLKDVAKSKGEGSVYAYIDLSKVNLGLAADMKGAKAEGKIGDISAKIVFYGVYITLYNAPEMTTSYAHRIVKKGDTFKTGFEGFGTKIGYANKDKMDIDVGVKFVSNGSWKDRDGNIASHVVKTIEVNGPGPEYADYVFVPAGHTLIQHGAPVGGITVGAWNLVPNGTYQLVQNAYYQENMNGKYGFGIDFHMTPVEKYLTVDANFNMTFDKAGVYQNVKNNWNDDLVMNVGANIKSSPLEGLNLVLGFDGGYAHKHKAKDGTESGVFAWALGLGADYTVGKIGKFDFGIYAASKATPYGKGTVVDPLIPTPVKDGPDMALTFGYAGLPLVEGLDIHTRVTAYRLLTKISDPEKEVNFTLPIGFNLGAAYNAKITDSMSIKPYFDIWGETNKITYLDGTPLTDQKAYMGIAYKLGLAFMPMERLTVDASWMHGKVDPDAVLGTSTIPTTDPTGAVTPCQHKTNNGKFILSAKITF